MNDHPDGCPSCHTVRGDLIAITNAKACEGVACNCRCHKAWRKLQVERVPQPALIDKLNTDHPSYSTTRTWPA